LNDIKIVQPFDIYNDHDIIGKPQMFQTPTETQNSGNNITFAPIIKINTNDVVDEIVEQQVEPIMIDDNASRENAPVSFTEMKSKEPKKGTDDIIETPIDFSKGLIVIKKA
jgi:hypothetical protein